MNTTQVIYTAYLALILIIVGMVLQMLFSGLINRLMKRFFPDLVARRALRAQQREDDRYEKRKRERELQEQRMLAWAFSHPHTPEGRRRLEKEREDILKLIVRTDHDVKHHTDMLRYTSGAKSIEHESKLAEATQRQAAEMLQLTAVDQALGLDDASVLKQ